MWKILQEIIPLLLIILLISQYILPITFNTQKWWLFKNNKKSNNIKEDINIIKEKVTIIKKEVTDIQNKTTNNLKDAKDLKDDADNLI